MSRVAIVQRVLTHYRVPFVVALQDRLAAMGHELELFYGQEEPGTVPRSVDLAASWSHRITNVYGRQFGVELVWQPCLRRLDRFDLVIVEQANRLLLNYALLAKRRLRGRPAVALWAHGRNFQATPRHRLRERFKRGVAATGDWWFGYTALSKSILEEAGVPPERITVVNNSIADNGFSHAVGSTSASEITELRRHMQIEPTASVGLFCGGTQTGKALPFLLEACHEIRRRIPAFHLVLVGDGPDLAVVEREARRHPWIHAVGALYGVARAKMFAAADFMLMPAQVGLAVIDSFLARRPLFTTDSPTHGPEISYLEPGVNGVIVERSVDAYAEAVCRYIAAPAELTTLRDGCARAAARYTLGDMVDNFARGIESYFAMATIR